MDVEMAQTNEEKQRIDQALKRRQDQKRKQAKE